jgi:hypothetical protein
LHVAFSTVRDTHFIRILWFLWEGKWKMAHPCRGCASCFRDSANGRLNPSSGRVPENSNLFAKHLDNFPSFPSFPALPSALSTRLDHCDFFLGHNSRFAFLVGFLSLGVSPYCYQYTLISFSHHRAVNARRSYDAVPPAITPSHGRT